MDATTKLAWDAALDVLAKYAGLKAANMAALRRIAHFEELANHPHPEIRAIGQRLFGNVARPTPRPIAPAAVGAMPPPRPVLAPPQAQRSML